MNIDTLLKIFGEFVFIVVMPLYFLYNMYIQDKKYSDK